MRHPKMLPCEIVTFPNSATLRQMAGVIPGLLTRVRTLPDKNTEFGATAEWSMMVVKDDRTAGVVINNVLTAANRVKKFDFATGQFSASAASPAGEVRSVVWSPDKSQFLTGGNAAPFVEFWDYSTMAKSAAQIANGVLPGTCYLAAFSPDGTKLLVPSFTTPFGVIINFPALTLNANLTGIPVSARVAAWSPDGNWLALGTSLRTTSPGTTLLYDTATLTQQTISGTLFTSEYDFGDLSFNPTSEYLLGIASGATSSTVHIVRISDKTRMNFSFAAGYSATLGSTGAAKIHWLSNYKALLIYPSVSNQVVAVILDVSTQTIDATHHLPLASYTGWPCPAPQMSLRRLAGTVVDAGLNPVARTVRVEHRESGEIIGETTSNGTTGAFEIFVFTSALVTVKAVGNGTEITKLFDSITPVV